MTKNPTVLKWLEEMKSLLNPDKVVWIDGSKEQTEELRKLAVESGELIKLNQELLVELKRAEDYLRITKENSLEANYLNKQLTRQLEEVNMQLRTARSVPSMNNSGIEINMSYGKTWSNTNNNQEI